MPFYLPPTSRQAPQRNSSEAGASRASLLSGEEEQDLVILSANHRPHSRRLEGTRKAAGNETEEMWECILYSPMIN
jgi:hypothetical protein